MSIRLKTGIAGVALAALLMACTPAEDPETNDGDTAATSSDPAMAAGPSGMPAGPNTPYSAAEQQMHLAMSRANGADPSETFALKMIEHHRGGMAMSEVLMQQNPDPELRQMAEKTSAMQRQEIAELEQWMAEHRSGAAVPAPGTGQPTG
jgi:uncharacterized protein (DUF305 family)